MATQFNSYQLTHVADLVEAIPWGDMEGSISSMEETLRLALEATADYFWIWEDHGEDYWVRMSSRCRKKT